MSILDTLKIALANHLEASLTVHGYHWNVEGQDFTQYHSLFEEIYTDYYEQVDFLAELIRSVSDSSEYVNASVDVIKVNKTIVSYPVVGSDTQEMCQQVLKLNDALMDNLTDLYDLASKEKQIGLLNYCSNRLESLNTLAWKLRATTKTVNKQEA